jgi:hypothetical protein
VTKPPPDDAIEPKVFRSRQRGVALHALASRAGLKIYLWADRARSLQPTVSSHRAANSVYIRCAAVRFARLLRNRRQRNRLPRFVWHPSLSGYLLFDASGRQIPSTDWSVSVTETAVPEPDSLLLGRLRPCGTKEKDYLSANHARV